MGSPTKGLAGAARKALSASAVAGGVFAAAAASAGPYGDSYHVWVDVLDVDPCATTTSRLAWRSGSKPFTRS